MTDTFGEFLDEPGGAGAEFLSLSFSPSSMPLKQRWRNNGLSADFLGDYVTTFLPRNADEPAATRRQAEVRGAVSYIANELLENAMKFNDESGDAPISMQLYLNADSVVFVESNDADAERSAAFRGFIERLAGADPGELYIQQMEANALSDSSAGLGFLTMISDYEAQLAWRFRPEGSGYRVTTQVTVNI